MTHERVIPEEAKKDGEREGGHWTEAGGVQNFEARRTDGVNVVVDDEHKDDDY